MRMVRGQLERGMGPRDVAQNLCLLTTAPIAACILYIMRPDICGPLPELQDNLDSLIKFYRYTDIIPFD